jgi:hypothetical protein
VVYLWNLCRKMHELCSLSRESPLVVEFSSHSRVMMVSRRQALRYAKKSPILIHWYPIKWVYYVNAQRLEWKQALSFAFLQLAATWIFFLSWKSSNLLRFHQSLCPSSFCWAKWLTVQVLLVPRLLAVLLCESVHPFCSKWCIDCFLRDCQSSCMLVLVDECRK